MAPKRDRKPSRREGSASSSSGPSTPRSSTSPSAKGVQVGGGSSSGSSGGGGTGRAEPRAFGAPRVSGRRPVAASSGRQQQAIPDAVANRMARRIAIATGIPTVMGMGVFIGSYVLVSRAILDIPPSLTLLASGGCFLLGLVGLSYGVLSSSWEDQAGSLLGFEQIGLNIGRLRQSVRAMRQGGSTPPSS